ncbi:hypothetical protein BDK51DRAFT_53211 [Blyttiomyces helicus]|uniref:Uncharacterized protein n=1 Tax=Blyttiomyces helicus TaxID=388810 RepID=A0A4P9W1P9_9FUNG|nr:hypothetical protein BDK51DRAFT_53211 [Blyttiomyces helicus]|eukprot:RKO86121.1 hypothetical protein BDK51DRAFT_53211 [Blyttiomyces helicus]
MWHRYAEACGPKPIKLVQFRAEVKRRQSEFLPEQEEYLCLSVRSAGPLVAQYLPHSSALFESHWSKGMLDNTHTATAPNPFNAITKSNKRFALHLGACPLDGFHNACGFATLKDPEGKSVPPPGVGGIVELAKNQLATSGKTFFEMAIRGEICILATSSISPQLTSATVGRRVHLLLPSPHVPRATSSRPLSSAPKTTAPTRQPLAPITFDVIDTSNLADHLGLLNVLVATALLLNPVTHMILHARSLLPFPEGENLGRVLENRACMELSLLSALIGLAPSIDLSAWCPRSSLTDDIAVRLGTTRERKASALLWRAPAILDHAVEAAIAQWPSGTESLGVDGVELGKAVSQIYGTMFPMELSNQRRVSLLTDSVFPKKGRSGSAASSASNLAGAAAQDVAFQSAGSTTTVPIGAKVVRTPELAIPTLTLAPVSLTIGDSLNRSRLLSLNVRLDVAPGPIKTLFLEGHLVKVKQMSPCTLTIVIGNTKQSRVRAHIAYPISVEGTRFQLKIARKSGYVEVFVPPLRLDASTSARPCLFGPAIASSMGQLALLGMPHTPLDILSIVDTLAPANTRWLGRASGYTLSRGEHAARVSRDADADTLALLDVKDSIHDIISYTTPESPVSRLTLSHWFGLSLNSDTVILLLVLAVRLDAGTDSVLLKGGARAVRQGGTGAKASPTPSDGGSHIRATKYFFWFGVV